MAEKAFDRWELQMWLRTQPRVVSVAIAARSAMRVVPVLNRVIGDHPQERADTTLLPVLRAIAESRAAAMYPVRGADLTATVTAVRADAAAAADATGAAAAKAAAAARAAADAAADDDAGAIRRDLQLLSDGLPVSDLMRQSLWPEGGLPETLDKHWLALKNAVLTLDQDWSVWTDWYEDRLHGRPEIEALEIARVLLPQDLWDQGPEAVNPAIRKLIEKHQPVSGAGAVYGDGQSLEGRQEATLTPEVPAQRAASIEPVWDKGELVLVSGSADSAFQNTAQALRSLKKGFRSFLSELANEENTNLDIRIIRYLERFISEIPETPPTTEKLFSFGRHEDILKRLAADTAKEWPDTLAFQFHGLNLELERLLKKFPDWVEFIAEESALDFTDADVANVVQLQSALIAPLEERTEDNPVAPEIPGHLTELGDELLSPVPDLPGAQEGAIRRRQALNFLESFNNVLKRIFEAAAASGSVLKDGAKKAGDKFAKGVQTQVDEELETSGKDLVKWLKSTSVRWIKRYLAAGAGATAAEKGGVFAKLASTFPEIFGWIEGFLPFFVWL